MRTRDTPQAVREILAGLEYLLRICSEVALVSGPQRPRPETLAECRELLGVTLGQMSTDPLSYALRQVFFDGPRARPHTLWLAAAGGPANLPPLEEARRVPVEQFKGYLELLIGWLQTAEAFFERWRYSARPHPTLEGPDVQIRLVPVLHHEAFLTPADRPEALHGPPFQVAHPPERRDPPRAQKPQSPELPDRVRDFEVAPPKPPTVRERTRVLLGAGRRLAQEGRWEEAVESFTQLLVLINEVAPPTRMAAALRLRARVQESGGEHWGAIADLDEALYRLRDRAGLERARIYYARARVWHRLGSLERALSDLGRALENSLGVDPRGTPLAHRAASRRARMCALLRRTPEALGDLALARQLTRDEGRRAELFLQSADILRRADREAEAATDLGEAARLFRSLPGDEWITRFLVCLEDRSRLCGGPAHDSGAMWALLELVNLCAQEKSFPSGPVSAALSELTGTRRIELLGAVIAHLESYTEAVQALPTNRRDLLPAITEALLECQPEIREALLPRLIAVLRQLASQAPEDLSLHHCSRLLAAAEQHP